MWEGLPPHLYREKNLGWKKRKESLPEIILFIPYFSLFRIVSVFNFYKDSLLLLLLFFRHFRCSSIGAVIIFLPFSFISSPTNNLFIFSLLLFLIQFTPHSFWSFHLLLSYKYSHWLSFLFYFFPYLDNNNFPSFFFFILSSIHYFPYHFLMPNFLLFFPIFILLSVNAYNFCIDVVPIRIYQPCWCPNQKCIIKK